MAAQTYQLVISGNLAGQFVQNIFHYRMDDAAYPSRLQAAKGLLDGWLTDDKMDHFLDMCPTPYIAKSVKARCVTGGGGPEWIDTSVSGSTGTRGTVIGESGIGPVIIWYTDGGNRSNGKSFIPGVATEDIKNGELLVAGGTAILTAANDFWPGFDSEGASVVPVVMVVPRSSNMTLRALVVNANISKEIGQQRRRLLPA